MDGSHHANTCAVTMATNNYRIQEKWKYVKCYNKIFSCYFLNIGLKCCLRMQESN